MFAVRDLPWALKPPFWFYTDEVNSAALGSGAESAVNALWTMDDARYYATLKEQGLSAADLDGKGASASYTWQVPIRRTR